MAENDELRIIGIPGIGEVRQGADLAALILAATGAGGYQLAPGDILVVTQKIVSKAEGRLVDLRTVEPSDLARRWAAAWDKDPRQIEVVLQETERVVRMSHGVIISQTRHGFVCANAGVDASNVAGHDLVTLLPEDGDASATAIRTALREQLGFDIPVIISDSFGRPWRHGIVNVAVGVSGLDPIIDYRGQTDEYGYLLSATIIAIADELACAAELVMGKLDARPVAIIRGYHYTPGEGSSKSLLMDPARDLFR